MAASVRTLVVSWKEAAEIKLSVLSEALVIPRISGSATAGFPPLLAWTLASGQSQVRFVRALARTADVYREEVARRSQWLAFYVPMVVTILICGGIVLIYAALTLGPWLAFIRRIAPPF